MPLLSEGLHHTAVHLEYARDLGLIAKESPLRIANPIYAEAVPRELTAAAQERCGRQAVAIHTPRDTRVGSSIVNSSVRAGTGCGRRLYESIVELRR